MTKVFISPLLLGYRQEIAEMTNQCIRYQYITGLNTYTAEDPPLMCDDLLPPPSIEFIDLMIYTGQVHDMINVIAFDDFGIATIRVLIQDEKGEPIESSHAWQWLECPEMWNYSTMAAVPSGASVLVSIIATNRLGAVSVRSEHITIP
jgi:hypothetical protein